MKITWFGHSACRLDFAGKVVLIDPFFTDNPAFQGSRDQAVEGVTHILVTHGHSDHIGDTLEYRAGNRREGRDELRIVHVARPKGPSNLRPHEHGRHDGPGGASR